MNCKIQFVPDGCYDELLINWLDIIIKIRKDGIKKIQPIDITYHSYLPQDILNNILDVGFRIVKDHGVPEYLNFVFDIFCLEGVKENYTRLQLGEVILLRRLFFHLLYDDIDGFGEIFCGICSLKANTVISTKLMECNLNSPTTGKEVTFTIELKSIKEK